jgi:hypothetical protein
MIRRHPDIGDGRNFVVGIAISSRFISLVTHTQQIILTLFWA